MKRIKLYDERIKSGLTQADVASLITRMLHNNGFNKSISKAGYGHIEAGRRGASAKVWDALEDLFGVDQRELRSLDTERKAG